MSAERDSLRGENLLGSAVWCLHLGVFVVWFPAVAYSRKLTANTRSWNFWRVALRYCPSWMRYLCFGMFPYAIANFVLFLREPLAKDANDAGVIRGFSGHWMMFYCVGMALLTSYARASSITCCVNGHPSGPATERCEICGARFGK